MKITACLSVLPYSPAPETPALRIHAPALKTFADLAALDPALRVVEAAAIACTSRDWSNWERFKMQFSRLAGWGARRAELRTSEAYEIAARHICRCWERKGAKRSA